MKQHAVRPLRPDAIVFDKDGVLADSEAINLRSAFEIFAAHGHALEATDEPLIVGRHPVDYVPELAERLGIEPARQRRIIDEQDVVYTRLWREQGRLFDGARSALEAARRVGVGVGLATSSTRREVEEFLERFGLSEFFDVTLTLDDVERAKPDPEIYLSSARELGVEPSRMVVIEDSAPGVRAAKSAGAVCVAVRSHHVPAERIAAADMHIDSIARLPALLG